MTSLTEKNLKMFLYNYPFASRTGAIWFWLRPYLFPFLLLIIGLAAYSKTLDIGFYLDDFVEIVQNSAIKHLDSVPIWPRFIPYYTFALNYFFSGLNVRPYHMVNIGIHLMNGIAYFYFLLILMRCLKRNVSGQYEHAAFFAALIFLVHPLQTQAVNYIIQRSTLLAVFSYVMTLIFYTLFRTQNKTKFYAGAFFFAFVSLFTKPIAITLFPAIILLELCFFSDLRKNWKPLLPFAVLFLWSAYQCVVSTQGMIDILPNLSHPLKERLPYLYTQFGVILRYLILFIWPRGQNLDHDIPLQTSFRSFEVLIPFVVLVAFFAGCAFIFRWNKLILFSLLFFLLSLVPESSFFALADVMVEHRMYLPMLGFAVIPALALRRGIQRDKVYWLCVGAVVAALSAATYLRNETWRDSLRFMQDVAYKSPNKARARNNLGTVYLQRGENRKAEIELRAAIANDPAYAEAYQNLGDVYFERNEYDKAEIFLKRAIELNPAFAQPFIYLGHLSYKKEDFAQAEVHYREAIRRNPSLSSGFNGLVAVFSGRSEWQEAKKMVEAAKKIDPRNAVTFYMEGNLFLAEGKFEAAAQSYERAILIQPNLVSAINNLGNVRFMQHDYIGALMQLERSLEIEPFSESAHFNLANVNYELGYKDKAEEYFQKSIQLARANNNVRLLEKIEKFNQQNEAESVT